VYAMDMIRMALSNDGCLHGFNDTIPLPVGGLIAWFCARRYDDAFGLWYGDHALRVYRERQAAGKPTPYRAPGLWGLLLRPDQPEAVEQPPLPLAMVQVDIQYGIVRSGTRYDCALVAGLKGSRAPYTHHNQPDTGSFFLHVRGERLLIDPGYYKAKPTDHSLPVIGKVAPAEPAGTVGWLDRCESRDDVRILACDSTAAYRGAALLVRRVLVLAGEEGVVLLDDILPADPGAKILAQYQAGGETRDLGSGRAIMIQGARARLKLQLLTRSDLHLTLHPERSLHDTHWGYHFADCRLFPLSGTYTVAQADPLLTVFLDATNADPGTARLVREDNALVVRLPSGRDLAFARHDGAWRFDAQA